MPAMDGRYVDGSYLFDHPDWHASDSPWKAEQVFRIVSSHKLRPRTVAEIGCGAGGILAALRPLMPDAEFSGYDISPDAVQLAAKHAGEIKFFNEDLLQADPGKRFDLLLAIDVMEHVRDYMGFLEKCRERATYKVYHIPLDVHVSSVLRNTVSDARATLGHLHYFTEDSALATLRDTGHQVLGSFLTSGAISLFKQHPSFKRAIANGPRWLTAQLSLSLSARLFGGFSLMVLTR